MSHHNTIIAKNDVASYQMDVFRYNNRRKLKRVLIFAFLFSLTILLYILFKSQLDHSLRIDMSSTRTNQHDEKSFNGRVLSYFNLKSNDASLVNWAHGVNSKEKLKNTIEDDSIAFIEADIALNKQNVVVMAHPPAHDSDLTFAEWFEACRRTRKGLKLDFKSPDVIHMCFKMVSDARVDINMPIMLNGDILQGNIHTPKAIINADYFLSACKSYPLPNYTIYSIGWTTINSSQLNYTWFNVYEMFNLIKKYNISQVTLPVRANWALKSLYRLDWLRKQTDSTLSIWAHATDEYTSNESILLFRKLFPISIVFYDLPHKQREYLDAHLDIYNEQLAKADDELVQFYLKFNNFKPDLWHANDQVSLSDYGGLMSGYGATLKTHREYKADENQAIIYELYGKFELFKNKMNDHEQQQQQQEVILDKNAIDQTNSISSTKDCIQISLRSSEKEDESGEGSVNIYLFLNGLVRLEIDDKIIQEGNLYSSANYFEFLITDVGENQNIHVDLNNYDSTMSNKYSLQFLVNSTYFTNQKFFIKIQLLSSAYSIGIDCLKLSDEISDPQDNHANLNY